MLISRLVRFMRPVRAMVLGIDWVVVIVASRRSSYSEVWAKLVKGDGGVFSMGCEIPLCFARVRGLSPIWSWSSASHVTR